jgi:predicted O-methyltransferase YrrM
MFPQTIGPATWAEIQRTEQFVRGRTDARAIPRQSAEFLHTLILAAGCRSGIEVGTGYGYSALWIGSALARQAGALLSIERDQLKVARARETFARAELDQTIRVLHGRATDVLKDLSGPFDFVFLDADKASTPACFEALWPRRGHNAVIVTDNIVSHADELGEFVAHLRRHPNLCSMLVDIGSGLELSIKIQPARTASIDGADWVI